MKRQGSPYFMLHHISVEAHRRRSRLRLISCFPSWKQRHIWSSPGHRLHSLSEGTSSSATRCAKLAQLSQTHLVADLGQALRQASSCADAPGQQISVKAGVQTHGLVQAVNDLVSFWSVNNDQPPILLLLLHFVLSRCEEHILSVCLSVSVRLSVRLSVCLSVCLSVSVSVIVSVLSCT